MNRQLNFRPGVFLSSSCARPYQLLSLALVQPLPVGFSMLRTVDRFGQITPGLAQLYSAHIRGLQENPSLTEVYSVTAKGDVPYRSIQYLMFIPYVFRSRTSFSNAALTVYLLYVFNFYLL